MAHAFRESADSHDPNTPLLSDCFEYLTIFDSNFHGFFSKTNALNDGLEQIYQAIINRGYTNEVRLRGLKEFETHAGG